MAHIEFGIFKFICVCGRIAIKSNSPECQLCQNLFQIFGRIRFPLGRMFVNNAHTEAKGKKKFIMFLNPLVEFNGR